jgi:hypothetical protein
VREWTELLGGDEVLATAVLDRLLHRANVLNIKGQSYRLRDLEQTLGRQKGLKNHPTKLVKVDVALTRKSGCRLTLEIRGWGMGARSIPYSCLAAPIPRLL